jgi:tRNA threonylcarbamoyladenosine biosynthesis protein TsaB
MILMLDTCAPLCKLTFIEGDWRHDNEWQADRTLAKDLLGYLDKTLGSIDKKWTDITAIGAFEGPGSFTGLRIGLTVLNTIADVKGIPIVGGRGEKWQDEVLSKLRSGKNEKIVLPFYNSDAHITASRK